MTKGEQLKHKQVPLKLSHLGGHRRDHTGGLPLGLGRCPGVMRRGNRNGAEVLKYNRESHKDV